MDSPINYIRIDITDCVFLPEGTDKCAYEDTCRAYFSVYPERIIFLRDEGERVTGAISRFSFCRSLEEGCSPAIRDFSRIAEGEGCQEEAESFFGDSPYRWLPVLDGDGMLTAYFLRMQTISDESVLAGIAHRDSLPILDRCSKKWTNITSNLLAKLVREMGCRTIKICIVDEMGGRVYRYFKHYAAYFERVEGIGWEGLPETRPGETLILTKRNELLFEPRAEVLYYYALQMQLEYNLLLHTCKNNDVKLYLVSCPNDSNIWNKTRADEQKKGISWRRALRERQPFIYRVLDCGDDIEEFIEECQNLPPIIIKNENCYHKDCRSKYFNVVQGERVTTGAPESPTNHIYLAGNSFVYGLLVDDSHTVASQLQERINRLPAFQGYAVVNQGISAAHVRESLKRLNQELLKPGDIVILFYSPNRETQFGFPYLPRSIRINHMEDAFNALDRRRVKEYYMDMQSHPNAFGYGVAADYLLAMLKGDYDAGWQDAVTNEDILHTAEEEVEDEDLKRHIEELKNLRREGEIGAVVVNCNPLTYGHKHLIEYAAAAVDHLFVFVAQEDRAAFPFRERFEMVKACVGDRPDITVLPSGRYVVSMATFPNYFTTKMSQLLKKEDSKAVIDCSMDATLFGKHIAPALNIKKRFFGNEPIDYITAQYNVAMKRILPEYGVEMVEIPRLEKSDTGVVSASKVRAALMEGDWAAVEALVPPTTLAILERKYGR